MKNFSPSEWIGFIISLVCMSAGLTAFAYTEFVTKEAFKEKKEELNYRLQRIEVKVDELLVRTKR